VQVAHECELEDKIIRDASKYEDSLIGAAEETRLKVDGFFEKPLVPFSGDRNQDKFEEKTAELSVSDNTLPNPVRGDLEVSGPRPDTKLGHLGVDPSDLLAAVCESVGVSDAENEPVKVISFAFPCMLHIIQVLEVKESHQPSLRSHNRSTVYVTKRTCGCFYVGQSDNLAQRLKYHHRNNKHRSCGRIIHTWYVIINKADGAKSRARQIETQLTNQMLRLGCRLQSHHDGTHKHFGIRD